MTLVRSLQDTKEMLRLLISVWKGTPRGQMAGTLSCLWSFFDSWLLPYLFHRFLPEGLRWDKKLALLPAPFLSPWAVGGLGIFQVHKPPLSESFFCDLASLEHMTLTIFYCP